MKIDILKEIEKIMLEEEQLLENKEPSIIKVKRELSGFKEIDNPECP